MIAFLVWASLSLISLVAEICTCKLYCIWFTFGGIVAMIFYAVGLAWYFGLVGFITVSVLMLVFLRKLLLVKFEKLTQNRNRKRKAKFEIQKEKDKAE